MTIRLSARADDDLNWIEEQAQAQELVKTGQKICWEIDLGIDPFCESLTDEGVFQLRVVALEAFSKTIHPQFGSFSEAIIIARTYLHREIDLRDECEPQEGFAYHLQAMTLFADYLHRLTSFLPEDLPVICQVEARDAKSKGEIAFLLSSDRFRHITLSVEGWWPQQGNIGCVIPEETFCNSQILRNLEEIFDSLEGHSFKLLPESIMNEQWDGLDSLILIGTTLSTAGKRKLRGFVAAGGAIIVCGEVTGIAGETTWEEWLKENRSRGIRTPDLLLPKQPR